MTGNIKHEILEAAHEIRRHLNPPHPGRGKNVILGVIMGFLLGPLGAGIYLRSVIEFLLCLFMAMFLELWVPLPTWVIGLMIGPAWIVMRILHDSHWPGGRSPAASSGSVDDLFEPMPARA